MPQDDGIEGQVSDQCRGDGIAWRTARLAVLRLSQARGQSAEMRRAEGAVVDAVDELEGQARFAVEGTQPGADPY
ncbi:hypothetical protein V5E97_10665 [Singulisphaera sp. Ch08]|uniref:Uncharacterized protein n=1 Tax=Singulisphaera sp. Ch08 TaxID=3120278 RepID=A0AAU7CLT0_9BACT